MSFESGIYGPVRPKFSNFFSVLSSELGPRTDLPGIIFGQNREDLKKVFLNVFSKWVGFLVFEFGKLRKRAMGLPLVD